MDAQLIPRVAELVEYYLRAKLWVEDSPFVQEVQWQRQVVSNGINIRESDFLREYAWVVLNSGFRETVIRKHFDYISLSFCDWESAEAISGNGDVCIRCASAVFGHRAKLEAIVTTAGLIAERGFACFKRQLEADPLSTLAAFGYIGDITKWHLAKNIGLDVAKPDRHLVRLAKKFGYLDVHNMCQDIHVRCGDLVSVVDLILWRFEERASNTARRTKTAIRLNRAMSSGRFQAEPDFLIG
jgi:hypothetical protein